MTTTKAKVINKKKCCTTHTNIVELTLYNSVKLSDIEKRGVLRSVLGDVDAESLTLVVTSARRAATQGRPISIWNPQTQPRRFAIQMTLFLCTGALLKKNDPIRNEVVIYRPPPSSTVLAAFVKIAYKDKPMSLIRISIKNMS